MAPTDHNVNDTTNITPPMVLADAFLCWSVASLPTGLATIIEKLGKEHIALFSKLDGKKAIYKKINDNEEFIPRSARIEFELSGSNRTTVGIHLFSGRNRYNDHQIP
jgi:hypothetical protein